METYFFHVPMEPNISQGSRISIDRIYSLNYALNISMVKLHLI